MIYTVPEYYNQFQCLASACPATCCAGWQIVIDEKTQEKYRNYKGSFGNRLKNSPTGRMVPFSSTMAGVHF